LKYSHFAAASKFIRYWLTASNGRGHGIHSPFVYALIREVLMDRRPYPAYAFPERYRRKMLADDRVLEIRDLGAGIGKPAIRRKVSYIARTSAKHPRYASLLFRLGQYIGARHVLELGTSLGVTTMYLAGIPGLQMLKTIEGAEAVADLAEQAFRESGYGHLDLVRGDFDEVLGPVLETLQRIDLVYVDGNHRKEPTLRYLEQILPYTHNDSCIVFDDIHWSPDMEAAWAEIRRDPRVRLTIDLHAIGLVFFRKEILEKQSFTIRF
jgi:predicted O-methyltransferase YrrM